MNTSLTLQCIKQLESSNIKNIYEVIPSDLYHTYVDYLRSQNFTEWKNKMKLVNLEVNLEDMEVEQDMYFDEPTYHIFVKNKIDDEDLMDTEFELVHEFHNPEIYKLYYNIAKSRNILDLDEEYL
tara:strand:- start:57 stop:431 length:375 start_codon:yes stop_codon:yes gene_type:complete